MIREFGERIYFAHTRNTIFTGTRQFYDYYHAEGDLSILKVMKAFKDIEFAGPLRPDHGRIIWGEQGQPGYGLYDSVIGGACLWELWQGLDGVEADV